MLLYLINIIVILLTPWPPLLCLAKAIIWPEKCTLLIRNDEGSIAVELFPLLLLSKTYHFAKPFVSLEECFKFRPRRVKCHLQKPQHCRITHFSAPRFVDLPFCFVDANANSCFCKNTCVLQWFLKRAPRLHETLVFGFS